MTTRLLAGILTLFMTAGGHTGMQSTVVTIDDGKVFRNASHAEINSGNDWGTYSVTFDSKATKLPPGLDVMSRRSATGEPPNQRLLLKDIHGGNLEAAPVFSDPHAYIASGLQVLVYDYTDPENPLLTGVTSEQPADGPINSLALNGEYLYATWTRPDGSGGLNVYSLAKPSAPDVVAVIDDYHPDAFFTVPRALAVVGGFLYMNDVENGLFVASLDEPVDLQFQHVIDEFNSFSRFFPPSGTLMAASGRGWLNQTDLGIYDVSDPADPVLAGFTQAWGNTSFQFDVSGALAVGVGTHLEIYDFSDPEDIGLRSSTELEADAPLGIIAGDHVFLGGFDIFQVWDIGDPDNPLLIDSGGVDSFGMHVTGHTPLGPLVLSRRDRLLLLDAGEPVTRAIASDVYIPGGTAATDVEFVDGVAYMAQEAYGMSVHDAATIELITQFEADLPQSYQARAFERLRVTNGHAYLASWGSGLVVADVSDPANPVQTGMLDFPYLSTVEVIDDVAFFATATNDGLLGIADVSDPAAPALLSSTCINADSCFAHAYDLVVESDHVFIAASQGGMYIFDVADPSAPARRSVYGACDYGSGIAVDMKRSLAFLACSDGQMHVIDISDLDAPAQIAVYQASDGYSEGHSVRVKDELAVFSHLEGVDLIDIADPAAPATIERVETAWPARNLVWHEHTVFAFTGPSGYYQLLVDPPDEPEPPDPPSENEIFRDAFELLPDNGK